MRFYNKWDSIINIVAEKNSAFLSVEKMPGQMGIIIAADLVWHRTEITAKNFLK